MSIKDNFGNPQGLVGKFMLIGMNAGHTPMAKWAFTQFEVPEDGNILDIGCGGGYNIKRMLEQSKNAKVYGIDISQTAVDKSVHVNKKYIGIRSDIYKANVDELPFDDNHFDLITAFETVYFWKNLKKCFLEVKRTLKDGGQFVIINDPGDPNKHWDEMIPDMTSWKANELEDFMNEVGFKDVKVTTSKFKVCVIGKK